MTEPTPEVWAQIRYEYEYTDRPIAEICAEHGITEPRLRYRVKKWNWQKRRSPIPRHGPPPVAVEAIEDLHPPLEGEGRRAASQARCEPGWDDAGVQQLRPTPLGLADASRSDPPPSEPAPGRAQARPGWEGVSTHIADADPALIVPRLQSAVARVLPAIEATIARLASGPQRPREMEQAGRTLSSLTRTLRELNALLAEHKAETGDDEPPRDIDEFRQELARRLQGIIATRKQRIEEAKTAET